MLVTQFDEDGCGPACGEMLLRDRGIEVDQATIASAVTLPVGAGALAARLSVLSGLIWRGGALSMSREADWGLVAHLSVARGTWAALLEPHGPASRRTLGGRRRHLR